ncbi:MAG TPA: dihydropteroate synthase [Candidatus Krumholzibacteria bacterium]|nr:dihydropteroate synthase [Candidatus Krumholzibacteria bacterium]
MLPTRPGRQSIRFKDRTLSFGRTPIVMGILNVTPDSFSDGGRFVDVRTAVAHAHAMVEAGAALVDVGGESTRPGSEPVPASLEIDRVVPVIDALARGGFDHGPLPAPVSIDTRKPKVADAALRAGATMVNDVTAGRDPAMIDVLRWREDVPVVLMHMLGEPKTMQAEPRYDDVLREVGRYLDERARALIEAGVARERIVIDPGIGFGKRFEDNIALLKGLETLRKLGYPVMVGASRKAFIGTLLAGDAGAPAAGDRVAGSLAVAAHCYHAGVEMIRVHDVRETVQLLRVLDAVHSD